MIVDSVLYRFAFPISFAIWSMSFIWPFPPFYPVQMTAISVLSALSGPEVMHRIPVTLQTRWCRKSVDSLALSLRRTYVNYRHRVAIRTYTGRAARRNSISQCFGAGSRKGPSPMLRCARPWDKSLLFSTEVACTKVERSNSRCALYMTSFRLRHPVGLSANTAVIPRSYNAQLAG